MAGARVARPERERLEAMMGRTPWQKILSYDADVTMVIEARGHGKTWGLREQAWRDWLKDGTRFVAVCRFETELPDMARDFFGALQKPNRDGVPTSRWMRDKHWIFRRKGDMYQACEVPDEHVGDLNWKPAKGLFKTCGYFVTLSNYQRYKSLTFQRVRRIILDEALIENPGGRHDYLPGEFDRLVSIVDSVSRETPGSGQHKPNVYLLGNAVDLANPYFLHFGVRRIPDVGFTWYADKTFLLYRGEDREYSAAKAADTVAGRMSRGTLAAASSVGNEFVTRASGMVDAKPSGAAPKFAVKLNGQSFSVWVSLSAGYYYVTPRVPSGIPTFAITTADNSINYLLARRGEPELRLLADDYRLGLVRFTDEQTEELFVRQFLPLYGYRR